jgi:hypothetical protein
VFLGARAGGQLTHEQRNQVSTISLMHSSIRTILTMGLMLWLAVGFVASGQSGFVAKLMNWLLVPGGVLAVCWSHVSYFRRLRSLGLPASYVHSRQVARLVAYSGWAVMLAWFVVADTVGTS